MPMISRQIIFRACYLLVSYYLICSSGGAAVVFNRFDDQQ
jgi:hypothetical protein